MKRPKWAEAFGSVGSDVSFFESRFNLVFVLVHWWRRAFIALYHSPRFFTHPPVPVIQSEVLVLLWFNVQRDWPAARFRRSRFLKECLMWSHFLFFFFPKCLGWMTSSCKDNIWGGAWPCIYPKKCTFRCRSQMVFGCTDLLQGLFFYFTQVISFKTIFSLVLGGGVGGGCYIWSEGLISFSFVSNCKGIILVSDMISILKVSFLSLNPRFCSNMGGRWCSSSSSDCKNEHVHLKLDVLHKHAVLQSLLLTLFCVNTIVVREVAMPFFLFSSSPSLKLILAPHVVNRCQTFWTCILTCCKKNKHVYVQDL